jgi:exopolysaccharide biosynthesis polyprenyl glycosylphosphotransferase
MIRLGIHYVEPRRIAFFVAEETAAWLSFVLAAAGVAFLLHHPPPALGPLLGRAILATLLIEVALHLGDLHDVRVAIADAPDGRRLFRVLGGATVIFGVALATAREVPAPLVAGLGAACTVSLALRALLPVLSPRLGLRTRIFLVGDGRAARQLVREVARDGNVEVSGFAGARAHDVAERAAAAGAPTIVVATDDRRGLPLPELLRCRAAGLEVFEGAVFCARALHRLPVELIRPSDLIFEDGFAQPGWLLLARRALSVGASLLLLLFAAPLLAFAAIAIPFDSRGPILFRQVRVGRGGRPFRILKFRTMTVDAETSGPAWASPSDPRVTRVGRLLRRFRLDELPQLFNVLAGDMELVGPRPERPEFVAELRHHIPYYDLRHVVPPGITGWAQVRYPYAASLEEAKEKLQYDLYYVRHLSLSFDLFILLATAKVVLFGRGAR